MADRRARARPRASGGPDGGLGGAVDVPQRVRRAPAAARRARGGSASPPHERAEARAAAASPASTQQPPGGRRRLHDGGPLAARAGRAARRRRRPSSRPTSTTGAAHASSGRKSSRPAMSKESVVTATSSVAGRQARSSRAMRAQEVDERAVRDQHALGPAGRARGVDDVGEVVGRHGLRRRGRRRSGTPAPRPRRPGHEPATPSGTATLAERRASVTQHAARASSQHEGQPLRREGRVEGDVGAARLEDGRAAPPPARARASQAEADQRARARRPARAGGAPAGWPARPARGRSSAASSKRPRGAPGVRSRLRLEQLRADAWRGVARPPWRSHSASQRTLALGEQRAAPRWPPPARTKASQQLARSAPPSARWSRSSKSSVVFEDGGLPGASRRPAYRPSSKGAPPRSTAHRLPGEAVERQTLHGRVLEGEEDLERRARGSARALAGAPPPAARTGRSWWA